MSDAKELTSAGKASTGNLGPLTNLADFPSDKVLTRYVKEAAELNDKRLKVPSRAKAAAKKPLPLPPILAKALKAPPKMKKGFDGLAPGQQRDYIEWINEAKTEPTREKRLATAIEWITEGKARHWKYQVR